MWRILHWLQSLSVIFSLLYSKTTQKDKKDEEYTIQESFPVTHIWLWQLVVWKARLKSRNWPAKCWTQLKNKQVPKKGAPKKNYDKQQGIYFCTKRKMPNFLLVFWTFSTELSFYFFNVTLSVFDGHEALGISKSKYWNIRLVAYADLYSVW